MDTRKLLLISLTIIALCFYGSGVSAGEYCSSCDDNDRNGSSYGDSRFGFGAMIGGAAPLADEAVEGFPETEWRSGTVGAIEVFYMPHPGFAIGILAESFSMKLKEGGLDLGTLKMRPVMLLLKFQGLPAYYEGGWAGHFEIGAGINNTSFSKGSEVTDLERSFGVRFQVETEDAFVFEVGAGADYFFNRNISLALDLKMLFSNVGTTWRASDSRSSLTFTDINNFQTSNIQGLVGLRLWL